MLALTPRGAELELHVNLLRHGRRTCHAQRPACERCACAGCARAAALTREPTQVWYLGMDARAAPASAPPAPRESAPQVPLGALNRFFYAEVGRDFHWVDRAGVDATRSGRRGPSGSETWLLLRPRDAGRLRRARRRASDGAVDVAFFGLLAPFRGRGLGGQLLTQVVERALGARRRAA